MTQFNFTDDALSIDDESTTANEDKVVVKQSSKTKKRKTKTSVDKKQEAVPVSDDIYIPSGCTLVDLACTDTIKGFCPVGHTVNIIGDSNAGKTMLAVASMAETFARYANMFQYKFYDFEQAMSFDVPSLFGNRFSDAFVIEEPEHTPEWSIEAVASKVIADCKEHAQFIVIDSADGMLSNVEMEAIVAGKQLEQTAYGGPRAKAMTTFFRQVCPAVAKSNSFMIVLSQAKDNMGFGAMFKPKVRYGGKALAFYAYIELWLARAEAIKAKDTVLGSWTKAKVERSKANGKRRIVEFPILPAYGIDNTRGNMRWLLNENVISKVGRKLDLSSLGIEDNEKGDVLKYVEENGYTDKVVQAVVDKWNANEAELIEKTFGGRKSRYE